MADITPLQTMMQNAAATATGQVKRKLANGNLIPLASCQCDEAGEWSYNFEILSPGRGETVFAAAGHHHGPPPPDGLALQITRYPPAVKPTENAAVNPGNLLLFHQFAGTDEHPLPSPPGDDEAAGRLRRIHRPRSHRTRRNPVANDLALAAR